MDDILETIYYILINLTFCNLLRTTSLFHRFVMQIEKEGELIDSMHEISFGNKFDMNSH